MMFAVRATVTIVTLIILALSPVKPDDIRARNQHKILNMLQVNGSANSPCKGSSNKNGTCFTQQECKTLNGTENGSCASGFGVCCIFTVRCGQTSSQNLTYFESTGLEAGECSVDICPASNKICQIRLDFETFTMSGPSVGMNSITVEGPVYSPITSEPPKVKVSALGRCLTDSFTVSNPGGHNPPTICGVHTGHHMYVEASRNCNGLNILLGNSGVGTAISNRSWNIKVTQFFCDSNDLVNHEYKNFFRGSTSNNVQLYNYDNNSAHLSCQGQLTCDRRNSTSDHLETMSEDKIRKHTVHTGLDFVYAMEATAILG